MTDQFSDPQTEFVNAKNFVGRLALITPIATQEGVASTMKGQEGKTYDRVIADVVLLDGTPDERFGPGIPAVIEGQFLSGAALVPMLTRRTQSGLAPGKMTLGRFALRKGNFPQPAVVLDVATEADKVVARQYLASLAAQDPFASA